MLAYVTGKYLISYELSKYISYFRIRDYYFYAEECMEETIIYLYKNI